MDKKSLTREQNDMFNHLKLIIALQDQNRYFKDILGYYTYPTKLYLQKNKCLRIFRELI